jgi:ABC-type dipeptide/oligopeptide/nickel transport system permease subunit
MKFVECPACRVLIDRRSTRCRACTAELERVHGGLAGTITGLVGGLVGALRGYLSGAIIGAIAETISGMPVMMVCAVVFAVMGAVDGYLRRSTRLRPRSRELPKSPEISIYIGETVKVANVRR